MPAIAQYTGLSCGAACLLCAAIELRATPNTAALPATHALRILSNTGTGLPLATLAWQTAIYDISGAGRAGYSLPSGVVAAATHLGMTGRVIIAQTDTADLLKAVYPHEIAKCLPFTDNRATSNLGDIALGPTERAMHCVRIGPSPAFHWILQRDDNTYMDPAGGIQYADRATAKAGGQSIFSCHVDYHGTGLAVKLTCP